jgi:hypothetical protein
MKNLKKQELKKINGGEGNWICITMCRLEFGKCKSDKQTCRDQYEICLVGCDINP